MADRWILSSAAPARRYGAAFLYVAAALALRFALAPWLGDQAPFVTFFPAVALVAWRNGYRPALLAAGLSALAGDYFFVGPYHLFELPALVMYASFIAGSMVIIALGELARRRRSQMAVAQDALEGSEARNSSVVEHVADAIITIDAAGRVRSFNPAAERLFDYAAEEVLGRNVRILMPEPYHSEHDQYLRRYDAGGQRRIIGIGREVEGKRRDGSVFPMDLAVSEFTVGRERYFTGILRDITDRRRAEQALRESENRYRAIVESQSEMVCRFNRDGQIQFVNGGYARSRGTTPDELVGANFWGFIPAAEHAAVRAQLDSLSIDAPEVRIENRFEAVDGERWTLWTNRALTFDGDGRWLEAQSTGVDITRQKQIELALRAAEESLRDADRRKDEFLAMLGHELRNPLAAIRSAAELVRLREADDPVLNKVYGVLDRQSGHMVRLIDGLLEVTRIARGKIRLDLTTLDLRRVLEAVIQDRSMAIEHRELTVVVEFPPEPVWVRGDLARLVQVFDNLLGNSVKFSQPNDTVTVTVRSGDADGLAAVIVRDTGVGIREDLLERIFEPFQQEEQEISREAGGLGLGLALARSLVELHDGLIEARSGGRGMGSEFEVRLPLDRPPGAAKDETHAGWQGPRHLLIVEDNQDAADTLQQLLQIAGYEAAVTSDVRAALGHLDTHRVDVVLCDLGLPGGASGYDLARAVRASTRHRDLQLIAITGYGQLRDRERSAAAGFDAHLTKPVDVGQIEDTLRRLAERRRDPAVVDSN